MSSRRPLILASVTAVDDVVVTYPACLQCYNKLLLDHTTNRYHCVRCDIVCERVQWRYRLVLSITDGTAVGKVVVFGRSLDELFGKSATDFHRSLDDLTRGGYPCESMLKDALAKTFECNYFYFGFKMPASWTPSSSPCLKDVFSEEISPNWADTSIISAFNTHHTLAYQMLPSNDSAGATVTDHMRIAVRTLRDKDKATESALVISTPGMQSSRTKSTPDGLSSYSNSCSSISDNSVSNSNQESVMFSFEDSLKASSNPDTASVRALLGSSIEAVNDCFDYNTHTNSSGYELDCTSDKNGIIKAASDRFDNSDSKSSVCELDCTSDKKGSIVIGKKQTNESSSATDTVSSATDTFTKTNTASTCSNTSSSDHDSCVHVMNASCDIHTDSCDTHSDSMDDSFLLHACNQIEHQEDTKPHCQSAAYSNVKKSETFHMHGKLLSENADRLPISVNKDKCSADLNDLDMPQSEGLDTFLDTQFSEEFWNSSCTEENVDIIEAKPGHKHSNSIVKPNCKQKHSNSIMEAKGKQKHSNSIIEPKRKRKHSNSIIEPKCRQKHSNSIMEPNGRQKHSNSIVKPNCKQKHSIRILNQDADNALDRAKVTNCRHTSKGLTITKSKTLENLNASHRNSSLNVVEVPHSSADMILSRNSLSKNVNSAEISSGSCRDVNTVSSHKNVHGICEKKLVAIESKSMQSKAHNSLQRKETVQRLQNAGNMIGSSKEVSQSVLPDSEDLEEFLNDISDESFKICTEIASVHSCSRDKLNTAGNKTTTSGYKLDSPTKTLPTDRGPNDRNFSTDLEDYLEETALDSNSIHCKDRNDSAGKGSMLIKSISNRNMKRSVSKNIVQMNDSSVRDATQECRHSVGFQKTICLDTSMPKEPYISIEDSCHVGNQVPKESMKAHKDAHTLKCDSGVNALEVVGKKTFNPIEENVIVQQNGSEYDLFDDEFENDDNSYESSKQIENTHVSPKNGTISFCKGEHNNRNSMNFKEAKSNYISEGFTDNGIAEINHSSFFDASEDLFGSMQESETELVTRKPSLSQMISQSVSDYENASFEVLTSTPDLLNECIVAESQDIDNSAEEVAESQPDSAGLGSAFNRERKVRFSKYLRRVSSCRMMDIRMMRTQSPIPDIDIGSAKKPCLKLPVCAESSNGNTYPDGATGMSKHNESFVNASTSDEAAEDLSTSSAGVGIHSSSLNDLFSPSPVISKVETSQRHIAGSVFCRDECGKMHQSSCSLSGIHPIGCGTSCANKVSSNCSPQRKVLHVLPGNSSIDRPDRPSAETCVDLTPELWTPECEPGRQSNSKESSQGKVNGRSRIESYCCCRYQPTKCENCDIGRNIVQRVMRTGHDIATPNTSLVETKTGASDSTLSACLKLSRGKLHSANFVEARHSGPRVASLGATVASPDLFSDCSWLETSDVAVCDSMKQNNVSSMPKQLSKKLQFK